MADLVERQAVKDLMLKYGFRSADMTVTEFVEDCLPSAQQWIPCNERLPEKYGTYLVTTDTGSIEFSCYSILCGWTFGEIIAWMPLPEPYQVERREDG